MQNTQLEPEVAQSRVKPKQKRQALYALIVLILLVGMGYGIARIVDFVRACSI